MQLVREGTALLALAEQSVEPYPVRLARWALWAWRQQVCGGEGTLGCMACPDSSHCRQAKALWGMQNDGKRSS